MVDSVLRLGSHDQRGQDNADEGEANQRTSWSHFYYSSPSFSSSLGFLSLLLSVGSIYQQRRLKFIDRGVVYKMFTVLKIQRMRMNLDVDC